MGVALANRSSAPDTWAVPGDLLEGQRRTVFRTATAHMEGSLP
jgi:hypothetical protein